MRTGEIWQCISAIGFDNVMHQAGDMVKIRELDYFERYNSGDKKHDHSYRVYLSDINDMDKGWMMDWVFLKHFEKIYESWRNMEIQEGNRVTN